MYAWAMLYQTAVESRFKDCIQVSPFPEFLFQPSCKSSHYCLVEMASRCCPAGSWPPVLATYRMYVFIPHSVDVQVGFRGNRGSSVLGRENLGCAGLVR